MSNRVSTKGCSCSWRARDSEEISLVCAVSGRAVPTFGGKNSESLQCLLWILLVLVAGRCLLTPVSLFPRLLFKRAFSVSSPRSVLSLSEPRASSASSSAPGLEWPSRLQQSYRSQQRKQSLAAK